MTVWAATILLLICSAAHAWVSSLPFSTRIVSRLQVATRDDVLGGVSNFETWFRNLEKASCLPSIQHAAFGSLRGLSSGDQQGTVLKVPKSVVLSSKYANPDWDAQLAVQLWNECKKGRQSDLYGYCSLLALGQLDSNPVPPSTASNALRHWTPQQLEGLLGAASGQKLVELSQKQEQQWKKKYSSSNNDSMTWEQFAWAMEVVHSRAFRGNYSGGGAIAVAAPIAAAVLGWTYLQGNADPNDSILLALAAVGALPVLFQWAVPDEGDVVLLPLIDSANHLQEADSSIQYDPLGGTFSLSVGPKCLVKENDATTQLYISYGQKSDAELLLNYGFLPGVVGAGGDDQSEERRKLAQEFLARN